MNRDPVRKSRVAVHAEKDMEKENKEYLHFDPRDLSIPKLQGLVQGAVAPRPIAFASTIDLE